MATIHRFEDLEAWKQARALARSLYAIGRTAESRRDFALVLQLRKTAISPMSNIAEGFARRSDREFANFLSIAHGSVAEAQSLLYVSLDQGYIDDPGFGVAYEKAESCSRLILALGRYLGAHSDRLLPSPRSTPRTASTKTP